MMHKSQNNDITNLGMPELPTGSVTVSEPPGAGVLGNTSATGVSIRLPKMKEMGKRMLWDKAVNKIVIECWLRSDPTIRGYRKRMKHIWDERGIFESSEQRLADQARQIRTNDWLTTVEVEEIKRKIETEIEDNGDNDEIDMMIESGGNEMANNDNTNNLEQLEDETSQNDENEIHQESVGLFMQELELTRMVELNEFDDEQKEIVAEMFGYIRENPHKIPPNLRYMDRKKVKSETEKVNSVLCVFETENITETNIVIKAAANVVADRVGHKRMEQAERQEPFWRRRICEKQTKIKRDLGQVDRIKKGELRNEATKQRLERTYKLKEKGIETVLEELKQRALAIKAKLNRYDKRTKQYRQNRLFETNQKKLFEELEGKTHETIVPDAEESKQFWSEIWDQPVEHNGEAEWLKDIEHGLIDIEEQENIRIDSSKVRKQIHKVPNWKSPGPDGVQGYWIKNFKSLHDIIANQLDGCLQENTVPEWMTTGKTLLCVKEVEKGNLVSNFRPITCLPLMWKLLTGILAEEMYGYLETKNILPIEQKGCRKKSRGTKDQLLIDKMVVSNCRRRHTNLSMGWIDYRKAYDMVPHSWITKTMKMYGIAENMRDLIYNSMKGWNTKLTAGNQTLGEVNIRRGIFQGDSLSPLLFVLAMIPLSEVLRKTKLGYDLGIGRGKLNHLLFMDDLKIYAKNEKELESLIHTVRIFSQDINMEFGLSKCASLVMKRGKFERSDGINMPNGDVMKSVEPGMGYKYLGILQADGIKHDEMKEKVRKEYIRRVRKILGSGLNGGNIITAINSRAVAIVRYGAGILKWTGAELNEMDRKTRKLMTLNGGHHPRADVDRLYMKRANGGRGLIGVEDCVRIEQDSLLKYISKSEEDLLRIVREEETLKVGKGEKSKQEVQENHAEAVLNKTLHKQFHVATKEIAGKHRWDWLKKGTLKKETESSILAAQDQALATNWRQHMRSKEVSPLCRLCKTWDETVAHIVSECPKLAQNQYKLWRHDEVAKILHWKLCGKWGFDRGKTWYDHKPEKVLESEDCKILWDFSIQTDKVLDHNKPDLTVVDKKKKECMLIDVACPFDTRIVKKEEEKEEKYNKLKYEIARIWCMKKVKIVPIIVGALGSVTKEIEGYINSIGIECPISLLQKACLLGTARIIRKVLNN